MRNAPPSLLANSRPFAAFRAALAVAPLAALVVLGTGCSAMSAASGGVSTGTSTVSQGQSAGQQVGQLGGQAKDLITGKKDDSSGDDDDRLKAKEAAITPPLNDSLNAKKKDYQDWRKFNLEGKPGVATFELFWDNEEANVEIDVFNMNGEPVGKSPPRMEGQSSKRILLQVDTLGIYYVRTRLAKNKGDSIYTVNVKWKGPPPPAKIDSPVPPAGPQPVPVPPTGVGPPTGVEVPPSLLTDPNKLLANIISAYRDNGGWVLYLDKVKAGKVHAGQTGVILVGADGEALLQDGTITISQVVDDTKSIARCNLRQPPGKNKRVVINLK
jgi:hypothetical protein